MSNENTPVPRREGLRIRKLAGEPGSGVHLNDHVTGLPSLRPFIGASFLTGDRHIMTAEPQQRIQVPTDYAEREPWIELVGVTFHGAPAGPASNPWARTHEFKHVEELVLHMVDGDYRYRVVHQPGKYVGAVHVNDTEHEVSDAAGDPNTHVDWFYDADLIEEG